MDRRIFIKNTAKAGIALSILGIAAAITDTEEPEGNEHPFFRLSLAQWSFHKAILESRTMSPFDFALKAREYGFEGIEYVSQMYDLGQYNREAALSKTAAELLLRSRTEGIQNVLIMVDGEGELAASSKTVRMAAVNQHKKWVDAAAFLGCHSIRVNLFGDDNENDYNSWKDPAADGLSRLSEYAAQHHINVLVENHGGLSSDSGKLIEVIRAVNLNNCGTLPDFGNFCVKREGGDRWHTPCVEQYDRYKGVAEMLPFAKGVSAKSYDFNPDGNETTIDYVRMLELVRDSGYNGFIGVEYEGNNLGESQGIMATRELLLKTARLLRP